MSILRKTLSSLRTGSRDAAGLRCRGFCQQVACGRPAAFLLACAALVMVPEENAWAHEVEIPMKSVSRLSSPGFDCPAEFESNLCFLDHLWDWVEFNHGLSPFMVTFPFDIGRAQFISSSSKTVSIAELHTEEFESRGENALCQLNLTFDYTTNTFALQRISENESGYCTNEIDYPILDNLAPYFETHYSGHWNAWNLRANIYITKNLLWIEVKDRSRPLAGVVFSTMIPLSVSDFGEVEKLTNVYITTASADSWDKLNGVNNSVAGLDTHFATYTFDEEDLFESLRNEYLNITTFPMQENVPGAASVILVPATAAALHY